MTEEILDIMNAFLKKQQKEIIEALKQNQRKEYLEKDYIQEGLKDKYSKVWIVAKLGLELDHYGNIITKNN